MWLLRYSVLVILAFFNANQLATAQTTMSSTDWEFQQILQSIMDRETRVKGLASDLISKINAAIGVVKPNATRTVTALENVRTYLSSLITVDSYGKTNPANTCNDVALRIANIKFDIEKCYKIKFEVDVNATLLVVQWNLLFGASTGNYFDMAANQRSSVQSVLTPLFLLIDEYNQYSLTLFLAACKYVRLYVELQFVKKNVCSCPDTLSSSATSALATIDTSLKEIQTKIDNIEYNIRNISTDVISKITAVNPQLKTNSSFNILTTNLDSITTLLTGYLKLKTTNMINATLTCDDAASKVAFIQYKLDLYIQTQLEAAKNASFVLYQLGSLNINYPLVSAMMSEAQRTSVKAIIASLGTLVDQYTTYVINLSVSIVKLSIALFNAKTARSSSCSCSQTSNSSDTSKFCLF